MTPTRNRRWLNFGLKTLWLVVVIAGTCIGLTMRQLVERSRVIELLALRGSSGVEAPSPVKRLPLLLWLARAERVDWIYLQAGKFDDAEARQVQAAFPEAELYLSTEDDCQLFFDRYSQWEHEQAMELLASLPACDLHSESYKVDPYIQAAIKLQAMGEAKAGRVLLAMATRLYKGRLYKLERLAILCRMLFVNRHGASFQRPALGGPHFMGGTDMSDWPMEPIELVNGIPFYIIWGYTIAGESAGGEPYVRYCLEECDWNRFKFAAISRAQKETALGALLNSHKWKTPPNAEEVKLLSSQIE